MNIRNDIQSESDDEIDLIEEFNEYEIKRILSSGNTKELCNLGYFLIDKKDNQTAYSCFSCFQKAAEQKHVQSQCCLGYCYENGIGIEKDEEKAVEWYTKAAEQDVAEAQYRLGYCYENGTGIEKDEEKAVEWYTKAAEQDVAEAQCCLGYCYENGIGIEKDEEKAVEWYTKAAKQDVAEAQYNLGTCYENGIGIEKDEEKAVEWYTKAAEQGVAEAQYCLGNCYEYGIEIAINEAKAVEWYAKAAAQDFAKAQFRLGYCYATGTGVTKNEDKALEYIQSAKDHGSELAQLWVDKKIANTPNFIFEQVKDSKEEYYIPHDLPGLVTQTGPYCGSAAFAAGINYSLCTPRPLYASIYEKASAGVDISNRDDIVLEQLKKTAYSSDGPQYNIHSFQVLAECNNLTGCKAILKTNYTEEEYKNALIDAFRENNVLILACDMLNAMPANNQGESTHWVLALGYYVENGNCYIVVNHQGFYCKWSVHDLYESNKQLPEQNPRVKGGDLNKFRYSFFKKTVERTRDDIMLDSRKPANHHRL